MNTFHVIPCEVNTDHAFTILDKSGNAVADVVPNNEEIATILAAAPELLAALQGLLADKYLADPINNERMAAARAAIAKATGN